MPAGKKSKSTFTWRDVATHNTRESAWVIVRGKVYDVTSWINLHPGGVDVILWSAGRDCTCLFESYHENMIKASKTLNRFQIGELVERPELPEFPERGEFFETLRSRVFQYFDDTKQDHKFHWAMVLRYALILAGLFLGYYLSFFHVTAANSLVLSSLSACLMGFACAQVGLMPLHDASHCAFTHQPWMWRLLGATHDFLNGASYLNWIYQHVLGHHPYTNVIGADPDISTVDDDIRRIKGTQPWLPRYVYQHLYAPFIYGLLSAKVRIQDINILFSVKSNDLIRVNHIESWHLWAFWLGKAFWIVYRFILPLLLTQSTVMHVLIVNSIADLVSSYWLAFTFQVNHVVDDVEWFMPNADNQVDKDWAEIQVVTAQEYAHAGFFWTNFAGALNFQICHHLFPNILQHYYPEIAPIVMEVCKEYGIRYRVKETWKEAFDGHITHLQKLGVREDFKLL